MDITRRSLFAMVLAAPLVATGAGVDDGDVLVRAEQSGDGEATFFYDRYSGLRMDIASQWSHVDLWQEPVVSEFSIYSPSNATLWT